MLVEVIALVKNLTRAASEIVHAAPHPQRSGPPTARPGPPVFPYPAFLGVPSALVTRDITPFLTFVCARPLTCRPLQECPRFPQCPAWASSPRGSFQGRLGNSSSSSPPAPGLHPVCDYLRGRLTASAGGGAILEPVQLLCLSWTHSGQRSASRSGRTWRSPNHPFISEFSFRNKINSSKVLVILCRNNPDFLCVCTSVFISMFYSLPAIARK